MLNDSPVKRWTSSAVKVAKFRRLKFFVNEILDDTFSCRQQPSSTIVITLSQNFGGKKMAPNFLVYLGRNSLFEQWLGEFHSSPNNQSKILVLCFNIEPISPCKPLKPVHSEKSMFAQNFEPCWWCYFCLASGQDFPLWQAHSTQHTCPLARPFSVI